ncbi:hypothetical protein ACFQGT_02720 [Natrialbaceae archaeon GCM10025810]|uniref:hypothetical protein n=1 Tax=Halovalidus salilacus TaxID=3075124 RepID=UPI00360DE967
MNRTTSIALLAILLVALVAVPLGAASVFSNDGAQGDSETDGGNESIEPGEQFSASVGVQDAEIDGDVSERTLGAKIANAETNETKAAVIEEDHEENEARLSELETRLEALNESREDDEISEGRYRAEVARTVAELRSIERRAAIAETTAAELPEDALAEGDVDVDSIRALRERAGERSGAENAEIARGIAGDDVGRTFDGRLPGGASDLPGEQPFDDRGANRNNETSVTP